MEPGKLQFDWEQSSEAIALISLGGKEERSFSLVQSLISEASTQHPQLSHLRFVHVPLPIAKLESWSYCLAAQLVTQWRELPLPKYSVEKVVSELGLSDAESGEPLFTALDKTALTVRLTTYIESLKQQCQQKPSSEQRQWIEGQAIELDRWFTQIPATAPTAESGCLAQLQSNVLAVRAKLLAQLQGHFDQMQQVGSRDRCSCG